MKLVIAGGSGFLGNVLTDHFQKSFADIVILTRTNKASVSNVRYVLWDATSLGTWQHELNHADVLINLTGKNVNCRYTKTNKEEILSSRINATRVLGEAIRSATNPPKLWIQAASSTIYNHSFQPNDETSNHIGDDFSMTVCKEWERAFWEEICSSTKKILMRVAIVLGNEGGAWPALKRLTQFGLGGKQGDGNQLISWVHARDFARVVEWLIQYGKQNGTYNVCSPTPTTNKEFMKVTRHVLGSSIGLPSPAWLLTIGAALIGTEPELVLKSRSVIPTNLLTEGFQFEYDQIENTIRSLTNEA